MARSLRTTFERYRRFISLMWERRPPRERTVFVYWILLMFALPLSLMNYSSGDAYVERSKQAAINLVLVFLTTVCLLGFTRRRLQSDEAVAFRAIAFLLLSFFGVFTPAIFSLIWGLQQIGVRGPISGLENWVSAVAAVASAAISYWSTKKQSQNFPAAAGEANGPKIIISRKL